MQQEFFEFYFYHIKGALKYKRIAMIFALFFSIAGWFYIFSMPDKYESKAKVHIDTATILRPLMKGMVIEPDVRALVKIIQQLMFTRPNLEKIIKLSLLADRVPNGEINIEFINEVKSGISITSSGDRDIFDICYYSDNPEVSRSVVQAVLTVFSENTQGKTMADASYAHDFIEQQIRDYEVRLQQAEKKKEEFKRNNLDLLSETDQFHSLQSLKENLQTAQTDLNQVFAKKNSLAGQVKEVHDTSSDEWIKSSSQSLLSNEEIRIQELKDKRANLLLRYTEKHPEIAGIDNLIHSLELQNSINKSSTEKNPDDISVEKLANPYVQNLKSAYDIADSEVAAQQALVDSLNERIERLESGFKGKLRLETELKNLNRDYETINKQYSTLLERREQAHITEEVDDQLSRIKFKIADPPSKEEKRSFPNRFIFYTLALIISVVLGFSISFLIFILNPFYITARQVSRITGLPTLGSISLMPLRNKNLVQKDWIFRIGFFSLLSAYMVIMTFELLKNSID